MSIDRTAKGDRRCTNQGRMARSWLEESYYSAPSRLKRSSSSAPQAGAVHHRKRQRRDDEVKNGVPMVAEVGSREDEMLARQAPRRPKWKRGRGAIWCLQETANVYVTALPALHYQRAVGGCS